MQFSTFSKQCWLLRVSFCDAQLGCSWKKEAAQTILSLAFKKVVLPVMTTTLREPARKGCGGRSVRRGIGCFLPWYCRENKKILCCVTDFRAHSAARVLCLAIVLFVSVDSFVRVM